METTYAQMNATEPDLDSLGQAYDDLNRDFDGATSGAERLSVVQRWDQIRREFGTWEALVGARFAQDTTCENAQTAKGRHSEIRPTITSMDVEFQKRLLASKHRPDLQQSLGSHAFDIWANDVSTFDPCIEQDLVSESKLSTEYTQLIASAKINFRGETLNLAGLRKYTTDKDRSVRKEALAATYGFLEGVGGDVDRIFDELVGLRHDMALKMGCENFVELGYRRMSRLDYGRSDVATFRREVLRQVVPLVAQLRGLQAERLGIDKVMGWDAGLYAKDGNPKPHGDHDWMLKQAQLMFDDLDPRIGKFFAMMVRRELLDLKTREGKAGGGFCTYFADYGVPFVFANFNGTDGDVRVFTHEIGHAFQGFSSSDDRLLDCVWPSYDAAEIHSMSLEFLTYPQMDKFFAEEAGEFRWNHLAGALAFLPYGVAGDHFQHLIYEEPKASPARRHEMWRQMESKYMPDLDWGDIGYAAKGGRWQFQGHYFGAPFYYIDYTLAQTCAMQFWLACEEDQAAALERYVGLCKLGGNAPFQTLVAQAGLTSPFEEGCLDRVVQRAAQALFS
ncbi:MAG: M3 family oligoendopeptidase [Myxococcota bacterium]|nr:M3 family oligoendopeptidase [Myxococcota bacterium]